MVSGLFFQSLWKLPSVQKKKFAKKFDNEMATWYSIKGAFCIQIPVISDTVVLTAIH